MTTADHPLATGHLPWFITGPAGTDVLYTITTVIVVLATVLLGVFFFWLHSLPERMGHKKLQFEIVAVLGLISLFTHMHIFWIIGLLLAVIDLPDVVNPLRRIARATEEMAGLAEAAGPAASAAPVSSTAEQVKPATQAEHA